MDAAVMRSGRGQAPNGNLVNYIVRTLVVHIVRRAMKDAYFFVLATGRSCVTQRDIQIGFMNAAHECCAVDRPDSATMPHLPTTAPDESPYSFSDDDDDDDDTDHSDLDDSDPGADDADATSVESDASDDDEDAKRERELNEFSTALDPTLAGAARERASLMKRRAYEWHSYAPSDPIELALRNAIDLIIRRVRFRRARP